MANKANPTSDALMRSLPARHPTGAWPAEMRADIVAAYFDIMTTGMLMTAIQRGEAPAPTATRIHNGRRVPVWSRVACDDFILTRHDLANALHRAGATIVIGRVFLCPRRQVEEVAPFSRPPSALGVTRQGESATKITPANDNQPIREVELA